MRLPCANLCHVWFPFALLAGVSIALLAGCGATESGESDVSGGAGSGGAGHSGGAAQTGGGGAGSGGAADPNCEPIVQTVSEYCAPFPSSCQFDSAKLCTRIWFTSEWSEGCGYVRVVYRGDVQDEVTDVYDATTGALIYHAFNGAYSTGCRRPVTAGTPPECNEWTNACGAGGSASDN